MSRYIVIDNTDPRITYSDFNQDQYVGYWEPMNFTGAFGGSYTKARLGRSTMDIVFEGALPLFPATTGLTRFQARKSLSMDVFRTRNSKRRGPSMERPGSTKFQGNFHLLN